MQKQKAKAHMQKKRAEQLWQPDVLMSLFKKKKAYNLENLQTSALYVEQLPSLNHQLCRGTGGGVRIRLFDLDHIQGHSGFYSS